jgi:hypothetical protein
MFCLELYKISSFFDSDVLNRRTSIDELVTFGLTEKNHIYLKLIRYIILVIEIKLSDSIELHLPRNTTEFFTYNSDKYWSKLIYAMNYITKTEKDKINFTILLHYIHVGGYVNINKHWNVHLIEKGYLKSKVVKDDIDYHSKTTRNILRISAYDANLIIDRIITSCLYSIREHIESNDDMYYHMIKHILNENSVNISRNLIHKYENYLRGSYHNVCTESENKYDMLNLFYDIM